MRCEICKWWKDGVCHKHSPKVIAVSSTNPYNNDEIVASTEWPITDQNDFCGEFRGIENEDTEICS